MERKFHVVFSGQLHSGFDRGESIEKMVLLFQLDRQKVTKLLSSGRPTIMKQGLSWEQARKYKGHLEQIGLRMNIIEADAGASQPPNALPPKSPHKPIKKQPAPKDPPQILPAVPPVTAPPLPKASKSVVKEAHPDSPLSAEEMPIYSGAPPFQVEKTQGWVWIKEAFGMLFKHPIKWGTTIALLCIIIIPVSYIPSVGGMLITFVYPIFLGGMMLGAHHQESTGLQVSHLFHGFRHHFSDLVLVSFFYIIGLIGMVIVSTLCISKIMSAIPGTIPSTPEGISVFIQGVPLYLGGQLIVILLFVPLMMGLWFAPCLVTLDNRSAFTGFRQSFRAVRINFVVFSIYALTLLLLGMLFIFLYGAFAAFFAFLLGSDNSFLFMLLPMMSILLLGIPFAAIVPLSIYTSYRDIFHGQGKQTASE